MNDHDTAPHPELAEALAQRDAEFSIHIANGNAHVAAALAEAERLQADAALHRALARLISTVTTTVWLTLVLAAAYVFAFIRP